MFILRSVLGLNCFMKLTPMGKKKGLAQSLHLKKKLRKKELGTPKNYTHFALVIVCKLLYKLNPGQKC